MAAKLQNIAIVDVETGGFDKKLHPITQFAVKFVEPVNFRPLYSYSTYVKPYKGLVITQKAIKASQIDMHTITTKGISFEILIKEIERMFKEYAGGGGKYILKPIFAGHNAGFDKGMLNALFAFKSKEFDDLIDPFMIDTLPMSRLREAGKAKSNEIVKYNLSSICERLGISLKSAHGAVADVDATEKIIQNMFLAMRGGIVTEVGEKKTKPEKTRNFFQFAMKNIK